MLKPQIEKKAQIVRDLQDKVSKAQIGILADFSGIKVGPMTVLRRQMKEAGGELTVAKNTMMRRAAGEGSLIAPISAFSRSFASGLDGSPPPASNARTSRDASALDFICTVPR